MLTKIRNIWSDEQGDMSGPVVQALSAGVGVMVLLGILFIFRTQIWDSTGNLIKGFYGEASDVIDDDQNLDVSKDLEGVN